MALNIKDPTTEGLVRELASATGEGLTAAIRVAVEEKLARVRRDNGKAQMVADLLAIGEHYRTLPVLDDRTPEEIVGYDENGAPI